MEFQVPWAIILFLAWGFYAPFTLAEVTEPMAQSWFFGWDKTPSLPRPVTEQCERIHITWQREPATGPNPSAPYKLYVFTSGPWLTPFVIDAGIGLEFDWDVPFPPGTIYQICMFDNNGSTGGCQDKYTVVKNTTTSTPACNNVTFPPLLGVEAKDSTGQLSNAGWINQCSDITVQPINNGTPPFTLYVAPPLRTPYRIVSNNSDPITWTVSLSAGYPFFLSLESSDGLMWSIGPQHSATSGSDGCLAPNLLSAANTSHNEAPCTPVLVRSSHTAAAGAGVGGLFGGILVGLVGAFCYWRVRLRELEASFIVNTQANSFKAETFIGSPSSSPPSAPTPSPPIVQSATTLTTGPRKGQPVVLQVNGVEATSVEGTSSPNLSPPVFARIPGRHPMFVLHQDSGYVVANPDSSSQASAEVIDLPPEYIERRLSRSQAH